MNANLEALLDLQVIDKRRQTLMRARIGSVDQVGDADKSAAEAEATAAAATAEVEKMGALIRQYTEDCNRCDTTINDLRSQQMNAKTNKEYMAIINGIENAKLEKSNREASVKELGEKVAALEAKAKAATEKAEQLRLKAKQLSAANAAAAEPSDEEKQLQTRYDEIKKTIDPAFLEAYERLVKANHKMPLMRIDPKTRATAYGTLISHNVLEQIRLGKLAIDSGTNAILFIDEGRKGKADG